MQNRKKDAALALFLGALLLLNFPLIELAVTKIGGWIPGVGIYLLLVWTGILVALFSLFGPLRSSSR